MRSGDLDDVVELCGHDLGTDAEAAQGEPGGRFLVELRRWHGIAEPSGKETEIAQVSVQDQGGSREPVAEPGDLDDEVFQLAVPDLAAVSAA
ncbi:MAG: hypothetical protein ABIQ26_22370 [Streptosporangiaceae bacterium]